MINNFPLLTLLASLPCSFLFSLLFPSFPFLPSFHHRYLYRDCGNANSSGGGSDGGGDGGNSSGGRGTSLAGSGATDARSCRKSSRSAKLWIGKLGE